MDVVGSARCPASRFSLTLSRRWDRSAACTATFRKWMVVAVRRLPASYSMSRFRRQCTYLFDLGFLGGSLGPRWRLLASGVPACGTLRLNNRPDLATALRDSAHSGCTARQGPSTLCLLTNPLSAAMLSASAAPSRGGSSDLLGPILAKSCCRIVPQRLPVRLLCQIPRSHSS
jgi:hypothetical protein